MARPGTLKCLFCGTLFEADARNARRQKYCSALACRKASKAASQRVWLAKSENQDYFRGAENVARVRVWRAMHPGYWRGTRGQHAQVPDDAVALQDLCPAQVTESIDEPHWAQRSALQDLLRDQPAVLVGFIAHFTGSALQDDIARSARRLVELGHDILAGRSGDEPQARTVC